MTTLKIIAAEFAKMPTEKILKASLEAAAKTALALGILKVGGMAIERMTEEKEA